MECTQLFAAARRKEFARGEMIYSQGDRVQQVLLITAGFAKVTRLGRSGTQAIVKFAVPGDVLGVNSLYSANIHGSAAQVVRACRALAWDAAVFRSLMDRHTVLHQTMVRILTEDMLELEERFREVATVQVGPRVARQLVRLMGRFRASGDETVEIALSREELAQMTGTTPFTVSRLLSSWEKHGIIKRDRDGVTICDLQALRAVSE